MRRFTDCAHRVRMQIRLLHFVTDRVAYLAATKFLAMANHTPAVMRVSDLFRWELTEVQ